MNREVEFRQSLGSQAGERTDICVDAVSRLGSGKVDIITAVIEVKGSWHREVETAIETQLADRYLATTYLAMHGMYVVGWYMCSDWDDDDGRKRETARRRPAKVLQRRLNTAARALSDSSREIRAVVLNTALQ